MFLHAPLMYGYFWFSEGAPDPPKNLVFQASPSQSLSPVLSWQKPPNIPDNVVLTYHLKVTNITSESNFEVFNDVFNITYVDLSQLPVESDCSLFEFNVTASNDVGNSTTGSINGTIPISKSYIDRNEYCYTVKIWVLIHMLQNSTPGCCSSCHGNPCVNPEILHKTSGPEYPVSVHFFIT